tara:strand:- start:1777 stop:1902 length:126 start_codon:yes stop_codon:yes gene_type:complete
MLQAMNRLIADFMPHRMGLALCSGAQGATLIRITSASTFTR